MEAYIFVGALALGTLLAVVVFAGLSKKQTEDAMDDDSHVKSTLAKDAPNRYGARKTSASK